MMQGKLADNPATNIKTFECAVNGTHVDVRLYLKKKFHLYHFNFDSEAQAHNYLQREAYDSLWYHTEHYIRHAAAIIKHADAHYTGRTIGTLDYLLKLPQSIANHYPDLAAFCKLLLQEENNLNLVLPHKANASYNSSLMRINSIINTANDCLQWSQQLAA